MKQNDLIKRYHKEFFMAIGSYAIVLFGSLSILKYFEFPIIIAGVISITPIVPIGFVVIAIIRLLRDSDELQQKAHLNAGLFSCIVTGLITFSYGLLENVGFPRFHVIWILPLILLLWGISLKYFWKKYQ